LKLMKKNTPILVTALSLTGIVLFTGKPAEAATTQATVSYQIGATTVWSSPSYSSKPISYLAPNSKVTLDVKKSVNKVNWYQLAENQWVPETYLKMAQETTVTPTATATTKTVVANLKDAAITIWTDSAGTTPTGEYLSYGTAITIQGQQEINGVTWFRIDQGWVPETYLASDNNGTPYYINSQTKQLSAPQQSATSETVSTNDSSDDTIAPTTAAQSSTSSNIMQTTKSALPQEQSVNNQSSAAANTGAQKTTNTNAASQSTIENIINAAEAQIGVPYVWGGKTPSGFDCSGLVGYAFRQAGKEVGGYTVAQESAGTKVSLDNLQPGDILFWGEPGASYHDAIYIGNNQYIDSPKPSDSVGIRTINSYFSPSFAVRVF
jgi:cell wall-associated NlpC family hydrolase